MINNIQNKSIKKAQKLVKAINKLDDRYSKMSEFELKNKTCELKDKLNNGKSLNDILVEAFATVKEASHRVLQMKHYDVQLVGGIMLHNGNIAEMRTGEGKTLVAILPAYLNALTEKGVHIVTVNDYLAKRDKEQMEKVFSYLGLTTGVILDNQSPEEKIKQYHCDITYGTNNQFGFDYLRDNMVSDRHQKIQRGLNFAIIDEVDSILIDEARTPLLISAPEGKPSKIYLSANEFVKTLEDNDFEHDEKKNSIVLTNSGISKAQHFYGVEDFMDENHTLIQHHTVQALRAQHSMKKDKDYIVKGGEVIIVDDFTGRLMEGRRYSNGLHQAIEAKEHVSIQSESKTLATITFQNYFRLYEKISGMTGTAKTEEEEFKSIYNLNVIKIPTNKPIQRIDHNDRVYMSKEAKLNALANEIEERYLKQQPILVGTISIKTSEEISEKLKEKNIPHNVLNAKFHEQEAHIIAQAGKPGAVTIATNMAGRGTDILLGGNLDLLTKDVLRKDFKFNDDEIALIDSNNINSEDAEHIRTTYGKVKESLNDHYSQAYNTVIESGGLCVIGTERHESRRIDNQLRGRSGRQGDRGESIFFLSFEDDLMRIFGGNRCKVLIDRFFGSEPDIYADNKSISKTIENSQSKVEGRNFGIRKQVVKYDDVLNEQRICIYGYRDKLLDQHNLDNTILYMAEDVAEELLNIFIEWFGPISKWNTSAIDQELKINFHIKSPIGLSHLKKLNKKVFIKHITNVFYNEYKNVEAALGTDYLQYFARQTLLTLIDKKWIGHIDSMDELKEGIHLRSIGQEDPVTAYRTEGSLMFNNLTLSIATQLLTNIFKLQHD